MKLRILQVLPGTIGGLPPGENFVAGQEYDVADGVAATMKLNGWAEDAAPAAPAPFGPQARQTAQVATDATAAYLTREESAP